MQVLLNENNEIISKVEVGSVEGGIEIDIIPENFHADYKPKYFILENGQIKENPNYVDPAANQELPPKSDLEKRLDLMQAAMDQMILGGAL